MDVERGHFRVGRILHEDAHFVTLEVGKSLDTAVRLEDGDRFLTLLFCHVTDEGVVAAWLPWEEL